MKNRTLAVTLGTAVITTAIGLGVNPASAAPCDNTQVVTVPYTWTLSQTTGPGKNNISVFQENNGPIGNTTSGNGVLNGGFNIAKIFNPPINFCQQLDPLPQNVTLNITGILDGIYANTTLGGTLQGAIIETYTKSDASIDLLPAFPQQVQGTGSGDFSWTNTANKAVGIGFLPYTGTLNVSTKFGFGSGTLGDFITLFSQLRISGSLIQPTTVNIRYTVPVPEPTSTLSLLALGTLGAASTLKRKLKSSKSTEKEKTKVG
jgi:hypothetical protein